MSRVRQAKQKSPSALRTIGEVTEQLGVPQHVLRFWESKFSQLSPEKHRGRRYYRQEDIATLEQIKRLLYSEGYTIKGVQNFLGSKSIKHSPNRHADLFLGEERAIETALPDVDAIKKVDSSTVNKKKLAEILENLRQSRDILKQFIENNISNGA